MKLLITGGSGFVGRALTSRALKEGYDVRLALRSQYLAIEKIECVEAELIAELSFDANWTTILKNVEQVVHLAARVHIMKDSSCDSLAEFRRINVDGTLNLARQAAAAGVKRFIFLSSIKVNGEFTEIGKPFTADDKPAPEDPYAISKFEAEQGLLEIASNSEMEVVIIRSPLVYGPGVKANFESMMRWLAKGVPLPLAAIRGNRRSLVALDNLIDLIVTCLSHPQAANQIFLVSDDEDISTADLLKQMSKALGRPAYLCYVPLTLLKIGASLIRRKDIYQRLCGSLQIDITKTRELLDWKPPISLEEGFQRVVSGFIK